MKEIGVEIECLSKTWANKESTSKDNLVWFTFYLKPNTEEPLPRLTQWVDENDRGIITLFSLWCNRDDMMSSYLGGKEWTAINWIGSFTLRILQRILLVITYYVITINIYASHLHICACSRLHQSNIDPASTRMRFFTLWSILFHQEIRENLI